MNEFEMIERYFLPLTRGHAGAGGLRDDAAVLGIPDGHELVVTSDTLNENVHFLAGELPSNVARKALRVNLSDLAAMGATPLCYQLNIAFPKKPDEAWLAAFSKALEEDNEAYGVFCSGGDTTSIKGEYLSISMTAMGIVPKGKAVRRSGAQNGDYIVLTGAVGDAYLGLKTLQEGLDVRAYGGAVSRYQIPCPRMNIEGIVRQYAHAAADISDGLLADCMHIANASGMGAEIDLQKMVFSEDVQCALDDGIIMLEDVLKGGDDYELILAVSPENAPLMIRELKKNDLNPMIIGFFRSQTLSLSILNTRTLRIDGKNLGWKHF